MWGALTFLLMFLVIDPTTREIILAGLDRAHLQLSVAAPLSYFLFIIVFGSAAVSALIMAFWPKTQQERTQFITRRYQGPAGYELRPAQAAAQPWLTVVESARHRFPLRAAMAVDGWMRDLDPRAVFHRVVGASQRILAWISQ